jgi:hypothetical protein
MKPFLLLTSLFTLAPFALSAQTIADLNIFNTGTSQATVTQNTTYPGFNPATVVDGSTNGTVFADYLRQGGSDTTINDQLMSLSNFSDPGGITSLRFYDIDQYEAGRVADQVTIYYSTSALTANSLNPANYTALNGGAAYTLPISSTMSNNAYTGGTDPHNGFAYDTLANLAIPAGTTSILFDFGPDRDHNGGPASDGSDSSDYNVGAGFAEIQAFGPVPEPSTYAMVILSLAGVAFLARRRLKA